MITRINYNCTELINSLYWELIENDVINTHGGDKAYEIKQPLGIVKYVVDEINHLYFSFSNV